MVFGVGVPPRHQTYQQGSEYGGSLLPYNYLGVVIGMKRLPLSAFNPLLERIKSKLAAWKSKALNFAGKSTFVQTVLPSIPFYLLSSGWVPKSLLEKVDAHYRKFLWSTYGEGHGLALASWEELCMTKANGGLGFRLMKPFHEAFMGKQLAKFFDKPL